MRTLLLSLVISILFSCGCTSQPLYLNEGPELLENSILVENFYEGETDPILRIQCVTISRSVTITSYGTAFLTRTKNGQPIIVTALHVVSDFRSNTPGKISYVKFYTKDRKRINVEVSQYKTFPGLDAAVFFVGSISAKIEPLDMSTIVPGQNCKAIGFPSNKNREERVGTVLSTKIVTTANVDSGMSGGPILKDGKVVGLISQKIVGGLESKSVIISLADVLESIKYNAP